MREEKEEKSLNKLIHIMESGRIFPVPLDFAELEEEDLLKWCKKIYISFVENYEISASNDGDSRGDKREVSIESQDE